MERTEAGRSYLGFRLLDLELPPEVARQVLALVAYHHDPKQLVRREMPERSYRRLARLVDLELLYHLEIADMRGRRCLDQAEQLEFIELYRLFAEEHGVFAPQGTMRSLYSDWFEHIHHELEGFDETTREFVFRQAIREVESGEIYTPEEAVARSYQYRDAYAELVVLCGPSCSGKSTWVRENLTGWEVVSMDDIRRELTGDVTDQSRNGQVLQLAKERLKGHLRNHRKVVWDSTNLRRDFRHLPLGLGFDYGAFTRLVVFNLPVAEVHRRNRERERSLPASVLDKQLDSVQWPALDEAHEVHFVGFESTPPGLISTA